MIQVMQVDDFLSDCNGLWRSVGWAGCFAHRLYCEFVSRGQEKHVPTLLGLLRSRKYLPFASAHFLPIIFRQGIA